MLNLKKVYQNSATMVEASRWTIPFNFPPFSPGDLWGPLKKNVKTMSLGDFKGYFHQPCYGWNSLKLLCFFIEEQRSLVMDMGNYLVEARCLVGAKRACSFSPTGAEFECWAHPGEQTLRNGSWHPKTQDDSCIHLKSHLPFYRELDSLNC